MIEEADGIKPEDMFAEAKDMGHICICRECAMKHFNYPTYFLYKNPQHSLKINEDYYIDIDCCNGTVCELEGCMNDSDYVLEYDDSNFQY